MSTTTVINKIVLELPENWSKLHKRFYDMDKSFDISHYLPKAYYEYLNYTAQSVGSSIGFMFISVCAAVSYILAQQKAKLKMEEYIQNPVMYVIFVGPPTTGKSQAVKFGVGDPFNDIDGLKEQIITNATSSGLTKTLSKKGQAFICTGEGFDVLNKLLESDEKTASGDAQLLCKMFSGESATYLFSTESKRVIEADTPFGILVETQMVQAARLLARLNVGNGLVDRFLVYIPTCKLPLPECRKEAKNKLLESNCPKLYLLYTYIMDKCGGKVFTFDENAQEELRAVEVLHIESVNDSLTQGSECDKSKTMELIPRLALSLHVSQSALQSLSIGVGDFIPIPTEIHCSTVKNAIKIVEHMESQKKTFLEVMNCLHKNAFSTNYLYEKYIEKKIVHVNSRSP